MVTAATLELLLQRSKEENIYTGLIKKRKIKNTKKILCK